MWTHWVARSNHPYEPFRDVLLARSAWSSLSRLFPEMLAAMLMPNHLHLLLPHTTAVEETKKRLEIWKCAVSHRMKVRQLWQPGVDPQIVPDHLHLRRMVRYIALNPCRKALNRDPLEWYWSTYREVLGATPEKTVDIATFMRAMREEPVGFSSRLHKYISSDETVHLRGTPLPVGARPNQWAQHSMESILMASAAALRLPAQAVRQEGRLRPLFVQMASRYGWYRPATLAAICGLSERSIRRIARLSPDPALLAAAEVCLGDVRFRSFVFAPLWPEFGNISCSGRGGLIL